MLVNEVVEQLRPVAPHHHFAIEVPGTPIIGNWDYGRLQQVLGNLLDNAIKYSDEGTTIRVRAWQTPGRAHISVSNKGVRIPTADLGQLFRPYGRLQATSSQKGTGLGLYITKSIVEAHGGELRLERSAAENQGSTFSFDLPL